MTERWFAFVAAVDAYVCRVISMACFSLAALFLAGVFWLVMDTPLAGDMKQALLDALLPEAE